MKKLSIIVFVLFSKFLLTAQSFEAGILLGTSFYNGDIDVNLKNVFQQLKPAGGLFGRYYLTSSFAIRGQLMIGQIYGDEKKYPASTYRQTRGFSFTSPITEIGAQVEWHAIKLDKGFQFESDDPFISAYGFGGLGLTMFKPNTDYNEPNPIIDDVSIDKFAVYKKNTTSLIGGVGVKLKLTDQLGIGGEFGFRKAFTDYLDGISKLSGKAKDYYYIGGLTLSWTFGGGGFSGFGRGGGGGGNWRKGGKRVGCPTF